MKPRLAVIIPAWNCSPFVSDAIESALSQSRPPDEIIVVDDGSTDDTPHVLESFLHRVLVLRTENQGPARARNTGARASTSDYLAFLDADDLWLPHFLECSLPFLEQQPESISLFSTGARGFTARPHPLTHLSWKARLFLRNHVCTSTAIVLRKAFEDAGGFRETDGRVEDYGLWLRTASLGRVLHFPQELAIRRIQKDSRSRNRLTLERDRTHLLMAALEEDVSLQKELGNHAHHRIAQVSRKWARACLSEKRGAEARSALTIARKHAPLDPRLLAYWIASWNPIVR